MATSHKECISKLSMAIAMTGRPPYPHQFWGAYLDMRRGYPEYCPLAALNYIYRACLMVGETKTPAWIAAVDEAMGKIESAQKV